MVLEHLPLEILINIVASLLMGALHQLMVVSRRLQPIIQRQFYLNSELIVRGADILVDFHENITKNSGSPLCIFGHLRLENYSDIKQGGIISRILLQMPVLQTLYFNRSNVSRALPAILRGEAARRGIPMARLL